MFQEIFLGYTRYWFLIRNLCQGLILKKNNFFDQIKLIKVDFELTSYETKYKIIATVLHLIFRQYTPFLLQNEFQ